MPAASTAERWVASFARRQTSPACNWREAPCVRGTSRFVWRSARPAGASFDNCSSKTSSSQWSAELLVSDIDPEKLAEAKRLGAVWLDPDEAMTAECDMLAPCALGGAVNPDNAASLRCGSFYRTSSRLSD